MAKRWKPDNYKEISDSIINNLSGQAEFAEKYTYPILQRHIDGTLSVIGTGVLVDLWGFPVMLTAAHVVNWFLSKKEIPHVVFNSRLFRIGEAYGVSNSEDLDAGTFSVLEASRKEKLKPLGMERLHGRFEEGLQLFLMGYPISKNKKRHKLRKDNLEFTAYSYATKVISVESECRRVFALSYWQGRMGRAAKLDGCSGCGVWSMSNVNGAEKLCLHSILHGFKKSRNAAITTDVHVYLCVGIDMLKRMNYERMIKLNLPK